MQWLHGAQGRPTHLPRMSLGCPEQPGPLLQGPQLRCVTSREALHASCLTPCLTYVQRRLCGAVVLTATSPRALTLTLDPKPSAGPSSCPVPIFTATLRRGKALSHVTDEETGRELWGPGAPRGIGVSQGPGSLPEVPLCSSSSDSSWVGSCAYAAPTPTPHLSSRAARSPPRDLFWGTLRQEPPWVPCRAQWTEELTWGRSGRPLLWALAGQAVPLWDPRASTPPPHRPYPNLPPCVPGWETAAGPTGAGREVY